MKYTNLKGFYYGKVPKITKEEIEKHLHNIYKDYGYGNGSKSETKYQDHFTRNLPNGIEGYKKLLYYVVKTEDYPKINSYWEESETFSYQSLGDVCDFKELPEKYRSEDYMVLGVVFMDSDHVDLSDSHFEKVIEFIKKWRL